MVGTKSYDINMVAFQIKNNHPGLKFEEHPRYTKAQNRAIDLTMSCDYDECVSWLKHFMGKCIFADDPISFMAVYDLYHRVVNNHNF